MNDVSLSEEQAAVLRERLHGVLERVGRHGRSCPLCHRAEIVARVADENPGWSRLRVELHVDAKLGAPDWRARFTASA